MHNIRGLSSGPWLGDSQVVSTRDVTDAGGVGLKLKRDHIEGIFKDFLFVRWKIESYLKISTDDLGQAHMTQPRDL